MPLSIEERIEEVGKIAVQPLLSDPTKNEHCRMSAKFIPVKDESCSPDTHPGSVSGMSVPCSDEWPEIQPVRTELLPVEPLPLDIAPVPFRGWIADVSNRMQCPPDFVAAAMLVMA